MLLYQVVFLLQVTVRLGARVVTVNLLEGEGVEERKKREERVSYCPERGRAFKQTAAAAAASAAVMLPAPGVREHGSKCQTRKRITLTEA